MTVNDGTDATPKLCAQVSMNGVDMALGVTYVTRNEAVVKIVEQRRILREDGKTIDEYWIGDNGAQYLPNGHLSETEESQNDLLIRIGNIQDQSEINSALGHIRAAERTLNNYCLDVIVRPNMNNTNEEVSQERVLEPAE